MRGCTTAAHNQGEWRRIEHERESIRNTYSVTIRMSTRRKATNVVGGLDNLDADRAFDLIGHRVVVVRGVGIGEQERSVIMYRLVVVVVVVVVVVEIE